MYLLFQRYISAFFKPINFNEKIDEKYLNINEINKRIISGDDIIGRDDNFKKTEC